jgi:dihydropyrimidinase
MVIASHQVLARVALEEPPVPGRAPVPPVVDHDPPATQVLSAATHHMNVDYSCYEGKEITGTVRTVLSRGRVVIDDGEYRGAAGHGRFLKRDTCQYLL